MAVERLGEGDVPGVVCAEVVVQFSDPVEEWVDRVADQAESTPGVQDSAGGLGVDAAGRGGAAEPAYDFGVDRMRRVHRDEQTTTPGDGSWTGHRRLDRFGDIVVRQQIMDEPSEASEVLGVDHQAADGVNHPGTAPEPARAAPIVGELVTETFGYDGGRQVTVYVPPDPPEAVVFAGDGQLISQWGAYLEAADVPPTLIVGAHRTDDPDEMARIHEYSAPFDEQRFAAHERFFVEDVRRWACSRFSVAFSGERTAVCGVSASAELALALGLRHPDIYGVVFCASPGAGYRPPAVLPSRLPRVYLVAGTLEPFFLENAVRWADALAEAGADVVMTERSGTHGDPFWAREFPQMVAWAFAR